MGINKDCPNENRWTVGRQNSCPPGNLHQFRWGVGEWGGDGGVWVEGARQIPGSKRGWGALIEAVAWSVFYVIG